MKKFIILIVFTIFLSLTIVSAESIDFTKDNVYFNKDIDVNETTIIDKEVVVSSNGSSIIAKNCNVFNITENGKLTLINLTISNGKTAIFNKGSLCLLNCTIVNNKGVDGGAIYNVGKLTVIDSTFSNNVISHCGAAIYNAGDDVVIENSKFISNLAKNKKSDVEGGGIYNEGNNLKVINCIFENNGCYNTDWYYNGAVNGAGIANKGENLTVINSLFKRNYLYGSADTTQYHIDLRDKNGCGIYTAGTSTLVNNTFDYNEIYSTLPSYVYEKIDCSNAGYGAGIYLYAASKVINNTFVNNRAGRAPLFVMASNCIIDGNYFYNNTVRHDSPGIEVWQVKNTTIVNNRFIKNTRLNNPTISNVKITHGENEIIKNNYFEDCGGLQYESVYHDEYGEYIYKPINVLVSNNIFKNSDTAIFFDNGADVRIEGNQFYDCRMGVKTTTGEHVYIINNYFTGFYNNSSIFNGKYYSSPGNSIRINSDNTVVTGNIFENISGKGTIVEVVSGNNATINGNYFINNNLTNTYNHWLTDAQRNYTVTTNAIIDVGHSYTNIFDNYFANNELNGGTLFHLASFKGNINNNTFNSNNASSLFMFEDYYRYNSFIFKNNRISNYLEAIKNVKVIETQYGTLLDKEFFNVPGTKISSSNNGEYNGDGSDFNDKLKDLFDFIMNGLIRPSNSTEENSTIPDNEINDNDVVENSTTNDVNVDKSPEDLNIPTIDANVTDDGKSEDVINNSTNELDNMQDVLENSNENINKTSTSSDFGDEVENEVVDINKIVSSTVEVIDGAFLSNEPVSRSVGIEVLENPTDDAKSYEINKKTSKNIDDEFMYLKITLIIIIFIVLIGVGYYRKK